MSMPEWKKHPNYKTPTLVRFIRTLEKGRIVAERVCVEVAPFEAMSHPTLDVSSDRYVVDSWWSYVLNQDNDWRLVSDINYGTSQIKEYVHISDWNDWINNND